MTVQWGCSTTAPNYFAEKAWVAIGQAKLTSSNKADIGLKNLLHLTMMHLLPPSPGKAQTTSAIKNS